MLQLARGVTESVLRCIYELFLRLTPANPISPVAISSRIVESDMEVEEAGSLVRWASAVTASDWDSILVKIIAMPLLATVGIPPNRMKIIRNVRIDSFM